MQVELVMVKCFPLDLNNTVPIYLAQWAKVDQQCSSTLHEKLQLPRHQYQGNTASAKPTLSFEESPLNSRPLLCSESVQSLSTAQSSLSSPHDQNSSSDSDIPPDNPGRDHCTWNITFHVFGKVPLIKMPKKKHLE